MLGFNHLRKINKRFLVRQNKIMPLYYELTKNEKKFGKMWNEIDNINRNNNVNNRIEFVRIKNKI